MLVSAYGNMNMKYYILNSFIFVLLIVNFTSCTGINHSQQSSYPDQVGLNNYDVVQMSHGGVSDDVIIGAIRSRGGQFDLSPEAIIVLNQQKVSDRVVQYMQENVNKPVEKLSTVRRATTIITPIIQPSILIGGGPRHHGHHYRHHNRHRNGGHFSWHW